MNLYQLLFTIGPIVGLNLFTWKFYERYEYPNWLMSSIFFMTQVINTLLLTALAIALVLYLAFNYVIFLNWLGTL